MAINGSISTYSDTAQICFFVEDGELEVTIETERLYMRSVTSKDCNSYAELFGDAAVMSKFATGETKSREYVEERVNNIWERRWKGRDPYSALAVFKDHSEEFIGHVVLGHGERPGESELAYLFHQRHWGQGFGTEAVSAVVKEYAPATVEEEYTIGGVALHTITATARHDNAASIKILEKVGMEKVGEEEKYGAVRSYFSMGVALV